MWQAAWKYARPNRSNGDGATEYELAVRYNYTAEEKDALIELISMLKSLESLLLGASSELCLVLQSSAYFQVKSFLEKKMPDMVVRACKKKSKHAETHANVLMLLRLVSSWEPRRGLEVRHGQLDDAESVKSCPGAMSCTRLCLARTVVSHILRRHRKKHRILDDRDLSDSDIKSLEAFNAQLFFQSYLPRYDSFMQGVTDLGELWYREFYLELSNRLQFEIESSLIWNLIDTCWKGRRRGWGPSRTC